MATTTNTADAAGQGAAMPQLDFATFPNQIFWLIVTLVVIYFILVRVALPRIAGVLAERQGTITNDLAHAEELKQKAAEAEAAYEQALNDARTEAASIVEKARGEIQEDIAAEMAKADAQIAAQAAESEAAIAKIRDAAVETAREAAKDVAAEIVTAFGGKADAKAIAAAVEERIKS